MGNFISGAVAMATIDLFYQGDYWFAAFGTLLVTLNIVINIMRRATQ